MVRLLEHSEYPTPSFQLEARLYCGGIDDKFVHVAKFDFGTESKVASISPKCLGSIVQGLGVG